MAAESNDQGVGELWELNLEDLFEPGDPSERSDSGEDGPYAIDLATSSEPATELAPSVRDFDQLHVYQVTDWQDEKLVFRLRLGPIESELEADAILAMVRSDYPAATIVAMEEDDQRMITLVAASARGERSAAPQPLALPDPAADVAAPVPAPRAAAPSMAAAAATAPVAAPVRPAGSPPAKAASALPDEELIDDFATTFKNLAAELLARNEELPKPVPKAAPKAAAPVAQPVAPAVKVDPVGSSKTAVPAASVVPAPTTSATVAKASPSPTPRAVAPAAEPSTPVAAPAAREPVPAKLPPSAPAEPTRAAPPVLRDAIVRPKIPARASRAETPAAQQSPPVLSAADDAQPSRAVSRPSANATTKPESPTAFATRAAVPDSAPTRGPAASAGRTPAAAPAGVELDVEVDLHFDAPVPSAAPPSVASATKAPAGSAPTIGTSRRPAHEAVARAPALAPVAPQPTAVPRPAVGAPSAERTYASPEGLTLAAEPGAADLSAPRARDAAPAIDTGALAIADDHATPMGARSPDPGPHASPAIVAADPVGLALLADPPPAPAAATNAPPVAAAKPASASIPVPAAIPVRTSASKPVIGGTTPPVKAPPRAPVARPAGPPHASPAVPVGAKPAPARPGSPARPVASSSKPALPTPAAKAPATAPTPAKGPATPPPVVAPRPAPASVAGPDIDRTQTVRALSIESNGSGETLLVVQLMVSDQEIAPESVPDLAIFKEYRLYCAMGLEEGRVRYALRLGFFTDEAPANAVAGYLRAFFDAPAVTRIGFEERERFGQKRVAARKDGGDSGRHARIELSTEPTAPPTSLADLSARAQNGAAGKAGPGSAKPRR